MNFDIPQKSSLIGFNCQRELGRGLKSPRDGLFGVTSLLRLSISIIADSPMGQDSNFSDPSFSPFGDVFFTITILLIF